MFYRRCKGQLNETGLAFLDLMYIACINVFFFVPSSNQSRAGLANYIATQKQLEESKGMLDVFRDDCGRYPKTDEGLRDLLDDPGAAGWEGPYLRGPLPLDRWLIEFRYTINDGRPQVTSAGPDMKFDTPDDINFDSKPQETTATPPPGDSRKPENEGGRDRPAFAD